VGVYATVIPRRFILEDGTEATLTARDVEERLTRETLFLLWVPCIDTVYSHLVRQGFEKAVPAKSKGEKYSLRKPLDNTWELHLRLYREGYIEAEVEVRREYLEHLTAGKRLNVVYEAYEYYREAYNKLHIKYTPADKWITKILDHLNVKLRPPNTLTPWKPIALGIIAAGLFTYALHRLEKGKTT